MRSLAHAVNGTLQPVASLLIACDFDGTITTRDTLHVIIEAYGTRGLWESLEPRLREGSLSVQAAMEIEFAGVLAAADDVRELVLRAAPVRAGFASFLAWAAREGHEVVVMSAGFRTVIDWVFEANGLLGLDIVSNDAHFSPSGCRLEWLLPGGLCDRCGRTCKRATLAARRGDRRVVYIGDGISDRCPARDADHVFARAGLATYLDEIGMPSRGFSDFHDIRRSLGRVISA